MADSATPSPGRAAESGRDVFIARQPILDHSRRVIGYELLFRSSGTAESFSGSPEHASATVITEALGSFGLDVITHSRLAFINVTRRMLIDGIPDLLPPKRVVLELLEDIEADSEVVECCRNLRQQGYTLALDDFVPADANRRLVPLADFVKVDIAATADLAAWRRDVTAGIPAPPRGLIAERVETVDDFERAHAAGLTHFQGFFLGRPATQRARRIPEAQLGYVRLLHALRDPDLTLHQIEELIKPDASLCLRVLRTVNSAGFGLRAEIGSIREALVLLGRDPVRRWVSLWAMVSLTQGSHSELLLNAILRARMCELLWSRTGDEAQGEAGFLLGMCSMLDAICDAPMEAIVSQLPLNESLRAALLGDDNPARRLLDAVVAYERGDWRSWQALATKAGLPLPGFAAASADAFKWANQACGHGAIAASA